MCVKPSLNPYADEWRPTPQQPPHLDSISASPPPPVAAAFAPPPSQKLENPPFYHSHPFLLPHEIYTHRCHPFYYVSFTAAVPNADEKDANEFTQSANVESAPGKKMESPQKSCVDLCKKGKRGFLPPRLRPVRCFHAEKKNLPPPQVWKPKNSEPPVLKVSGDGGANRSSPPIPPFSTVMIKNIPNELRRDSMLKFLDGLCKLHSLEYDFLYLPMDFRRKHNLGYAFLNLTSTAAAGKFKKVLDNYKWGVIHTDEGQIVSKKICEITWARIQGKEALIRRFRNANFICDELDFLPVVLDPPRNGSDPNPPAPVVTGRLCGRRNF